MGFLDKIFGKKETETISTNLELLPTIIQKNFDVKRRELENFSAKKMSEVKYLFGKSNTLLKDIKNKEMESKENERLNKAALTAKTQMENQIKKMLEKIDPKNTSNELEEVYAYSKESFVFLFNEINSYRKSIAYTSIYLKDEMKEFGTVLNELLQNLKEINDEFDSNKNVFTFKKINEEINNMQLLKKDIELKEIEKEKNNKNIFEIDEEIKQFENEIDKLRNNADSGKLKEIEEKKSELLNQKQSLKIELSSMISTVEKPLNKYLIIAKGGRENIEKEEIELLDLFLTNPIYALKKDIKGERIKEILKKVLKAISDDKVELKEKEKEKRSDAINELINFDFFGNIFWKINKIQKELNEIEEEIKNSEVMGNIKNIEKKVDEKIKEKKEITKKVENLEKEISNKKEKYQNDLEKIRVFSERVLNKKVIIEE
jgi:hypothetical protein